jgi:hypothetical protein
MFPRPVRRAPTSPALCLVVVRVVRGRVIPVVIIPASFLAVISRALCLVVARVVLRLAVPAVISPASPPAAGRAPTSPGPCPVGQTPGSPGPCPVGQTSGSPGPCPAIAAVPIRRVAAGAPATTTPATSSRIRLVLFVVVVWCRIRPGPFVAVMPRRIRLVLFVVVVWCRIRPGPFVAVMPRRISPVDTPRPMR